MQSILITLTVAGSGTGPLFDIYTDVDSYTTPIVTGITRTQLLIGYLCAVVPDGATIVRVKSTSSCLNYVNLGISGLTTTSTTTTLPVTTTTTTNEATTTTTTTGVTTTTTTNAATTTSTTVAATTTTTTVEPTTTTTTTNSTTTTTTLPDCTITGTAEVGVEV